MIIDEIIDRFKMNGMRAREVSIDDNEAMIVVEEIRVDITGRGYGVKKIIDLKTLENHWSLGGIIEYTKKEFDEAFINIEKDNNITV